MPTKLIENSALRLSSRLRYRAVGDDGVLVHLETGRVIVVNEVAFYIVQQLGEHRMTMPELADSLVREFEVEPDKAMSDVSVFLVELEEEKGLERSPSAA